jgi:ATP-dependent Lhr-like helicase
MADALESFHPAVRAWFAGAFDAPTAVQRGAWPGIAAGRHTLLAAPTGSGKTLAAFLAAIDGLVREGLAQGLPDEVRVLYVSPLKALSNDIRRNLEVPLDGIALALRELGLDPPAIRAMVRTGDTDARERARMRRQPPHILVTTPESVCILLTSESGRAALAGVRTVIVDEIHAVAGSKRGAHLALSLERLEALVGGRLTRVGCSATQDPIEHMARFLVGARNGGRDGDVDIVDTGQARPRDLALELPDSPLEAVMANEAWEEVYDRLATLVRAHRTTLVFANARRQVERVTKHLAERLGEDAVTAHHGALARELRLDAERRLKDGGLRCLVATASLELGIDIGDVDLVCQLGSPRSIAAFVQRVGRSGHRIDAEPKGRLFPLTRDDLVECTALLRASRLGQLDRIRIPDRPLDVLAQQVVAEVAGAGEWDATALFEAFRRAWPYRSLERREFDDVVRMLAEGFSTRRGRRGAHLHHDAVHGRLRARRGARITAVTNAGTIPDTFDCDVILAPEGFRVGSVNEDFAFESLPGSIFQLGNVSYRILRIEQGRVHVADARGEPPTIPFWFGEAPGRSRELSRAVSDLRADVDRVLAERGLDAAADALERDYAVPREAALQLAVYLGAARAALGCVPTQQHVVMERFFDETGSMHLVVHSPYGSAVNRAWGLSLRKRFCRKFNFELQAAALEDAIVLSLGATHSFPVDEPARYLHSSSVRGVLSQAVLGAPMFGTRWRWVASIALAVKRNVGGRRAPPPFQRADAEDLVALVFPDQLACAENLGGGDRDIPDHPLVNQTIADCLHEVTDVEGLEAILRGLEGGSITIRGIDLHTPSPLAQEILTAKPYAFLDDAPAEERRTLAVRTRRFTDPAEAGDLGRLDASAIARVRAEASPEPRDADELHDALVVLGFLTEAEGRRGGLCHGDAGPAETATGWSPWFRELVADDRATRVRVDGGEPIWVAAERLREMRLVLGDAAVEEPVIRAVEDSRNPVADRGEALREIVRSRLEGLGPVTASDLGAPIGRGAAETGAALLALEGEGFVLRGRFTEAAAASGAEEEWCERRLLARIHRHTIGRLRSEIAPVSAADYLRFLFTWHGIGDRREGTEGLRAAMEQLEGFSASASAWETEILPARVEGYAGHLLDGLCTRGDLAWLRLTVRPDAGARRAAPVRNTPVALVDRDAVPLWRQMAPAANPVEANLSSAARKVHEALQRGGALFADDLLRATGLLQAQLDEALGELVNWGLVTSDSLAGLRALVTPAERRGPETRGARRSRIRASRTEGAGRWSLLPADPGVDRHEALEHVAWALLHRYGVVFRKVLEREALLPPWRELLRVYWRLEARGDIRGGRFVDRFAGEQFALPDAVGELRKTRRREHGDDLVRISAADPLNLVGIVTPGDRVPATASNAVLFRGGVPVAARVGDTFTALGANVEVDGDVRRRLTIRRAAGFR